MINMRLIKRIQLFISFVYLVYSVCMICEAVSSFTLVNGMGNPITLVSKVFLVLVVKFELKAPVTFLRASFYWRPSPV